MAREYAKENVMLELAQRRYNVVAMTIAISFACVFISLLPVSSGLSAYGMLLIFGLPPAAMLFLCTAAYSHHHWLEGERQKESVRRGGRPVLGMPPHRDAFKVAMRDVKARGKIMMDRYLVGFEVDSGAAIWVTDDEMCSHGCVFAKTGVGKTLWLEGLMFQQMARGRASGFTFIDAKRDSGVLADIIMMAIITGRIEDLIVVDPFDPVCAYNFVFTTQRPDVKARKVLRCGLPPAADSSPTKHYDRLAADAVYRIVRCMESLGLAWSVRDVAIALSAFNFAYPRLRELLHEQGAKQAMVELGHLASTYRTAKGQLDAARLNDNLRGIAAELSSISNSEAGEMFCAPVADLSLTDAILRGKFIYYMLPRLEEAESAARMVKVFREDLEVSIGEITSSRSHRLEDPHLVIIDEGASTFGPTWANLFELARKGRFALLFGAQSVGGLMDEQMGLSEQFYERVIANVNLKVIMRIGDNRTAEDMCEWIGKVSTTKKSLATGISSSLNARQLTKHLEINKRAADGSRDAVTVSEDEEDLVSAEELKHEMSAEKGLAWFDKGDGRLRKGRAIWFEAELPSSWEGREFLTHYETVEADEIGLAEWVDEHILSIERVEVERGLEQSQGMQSSAASGSMGGSTGGSMGSSGGSSFSAGSNSSGASSASSAGDSADANKEDDGSPFRFNMMRGFRGRGRASTFNAPETPPAAPVAATSQTTALSANNAPTSNTPAASTAASVVPGVVPGVVPSVVPAGAATASTTIAKASAPTSAPLTIKTTQAVATNSQQSNSQIAKSATQTSEVKTFGSASANSATAPADVNPSGTPPSGIQQARPQPNKPEPKARGQLQFRQDPKTAPAQGEPTAQKIAEPSSSQPATRPQPTKPQPGRAPQPARPPQGKQVSQQPTSQTQPQTQHQSSAQAAVSQSQSQSQAHTQAQTLAQPQPKPVQAQPERRGNGPAAASESKTRDSATPAHNGNNSGLKPDNSSRGGRSAPNGPIPAPQQPQGDARPQQSGDQQSGAGQRPSANKMMFKGKSKDTTVQAGNKNR